MAENKIEIEIVLDDGKTRKGFVKVEDLAKKSGKKIGKNLDEGVSRLGSSLKSIGIQLVAIGSLFATAFVGKKAIDGAILAEKAVSDLNVALQTAGTFSLETTARIQTFADEMEDLTGVAAESTLEMTGLAQSFVTTAKEAQELTRAALDFSTGAGISFEESIRRLGRGVQGSSGDIANFAPEIRQLTRDQLLAGEATRILGERFAGAADLTNTFNDRAIAFNNTMGRVLDAIGNIVIKSPVFLAVLENISERFSGVAKSLEDLESSGDIFGDIIKDMITFGLVVNRFIVAPIEISVRVIKLAFTTVAAIIQSQVQLIAGLASKVASLFAPNSEVAKNLKLFAEASKIGLRDLSDDVVKSFDAILDFDITAASEKFLTELQTVADNAKAITADMADGMSNNLKNGADKILATVVDLRQILVGGLSSAMQGVGAALAKGEDAFAAFGKGILNILGDIAIKIGTEFLLIGIGVEQLKLTLATLTGGFAIAAGLALIAFGGVLKSIGGGGLVAAATGSQGAVSGGIPTTIDDISSIEAPETIAPPTQVVINVEGTVLDPRGVGMQIAEILNDTFGSNDTGIITRTA